MLASAVRFDWYEATIDGHDHDGFAANLALSSGSELAPATARNGYAAAVAVAQDERVLATVYGRSARAGEVHVTITGDACDELVPVVRRLRPNHRVSRVDSAVDFAADFDPLDALAVAFALEHGLKHRLVSDSDGGATRYLGARSSEVRVRVYKKSEQLRQLHPDLAGEVPDGIVRAECQARPGKREAKEAAAQLDAADVWGLSQWSALFAAQRLDLEPLRTATHFRRATDWARMLHWLGEQYGPAIQRQLASRDEDEVRREVLAALGITPQEVR